MMTSPSSDATDWDPLGLSAPAGRALVMLRPENAAAKWAFSEVVDFIQEQDHNLEGEGLVSLRSHYAQFIWFSDKQVSDTLVTRLVNHRPREDRSSSSPSSSSSDHFTQPVTFWTGFFFLDPAVPPLLDRLGWSVGRLSKNSLSLGKPTADLLLTTNRKSQVARRHAFISFSNETRLARISLDSGSSATVNNNSLSFRGSTAACNSAHNSVWFEGLQYTLEYTPNCYRSQGQASLDAYLTAIHGDDQPTREALLATPTPTINGQTIGQYTITAAGLVGMGTFGRVRPATGPQGDKVVAIKTLEARRSNAQPVRNKIEMMETLSRHMSAKNQLNVLRVIESIHIPGNHTDEFHIVLEPFVDLTLDKIPRETHRTKFELMLRDCLQGLSFLHAHRFIHTDIKPTNIGLINLRLDQIEKEASCPPPFSPRPIRAILLDLDSMERIPSDRTTIVAQPGANGTIGFHSPEHESSEYDGRTDVWALGVSFFRVVFGRLPWSYGKQGNPWRSNVPEQTQARALFHSRYKAALYDISDHYQDHGDSVCDFLITSFRFPLAEISSQRQMRPTSADCLHNILQRSDFLKTRTADEQQQVGASNITIGGRAKRPAQE